MSPVRLDRDARGRATSRARCACGAAVVSLAALAFGSCSASGEGGDEAMPPPGAGASSGFGGTAGGSGTDAGTGDGPRAETEAGGAGGAGGTAGKGGTSGAGGKGGTGGATPGDAGGDGVVKDAKHDDGASASACKPPGPSWVDVQTVDVANNAAPGRTGQWWCEKHFGGNLGGAWECVKAPADCAADVPANGKVTCGRLGADGSTPYCGSGEDGGALGYGRVESLLVTQSAPGRTGLWWCQSHFGGNLGGEWKCRGVSGAHACTATAPNGELVTCSQYDDVQSVKVSSPAPGQTGSWWCDQHFGKNLGGSWDCLRVVPGTCDADAAASATVTCGRYTPVDESAFAPPGCGSPELDGSERDFCNLTEYMTTRAGRTLYLTNNWLRAGFSRSFGGALFELYGADKRNRIEEHGGAAVQLSVWGYDKSATGSGFFTTQSCNPTPFSDGAACAAANGGVACGFYPATGGQICNCTSVLPCGGWSAGAPWNPIQAQAAGCGWNGPSNDVASVTQNANGVQLAQNAPYHFTKTTAYAGMAWWVAGLAPGDRPYVRLRYHMSWSGSPAVGEHNQEIPAIFTDNRTGDWYYYYSGAKPYADAAGLVTRLRSDFGTELALPGRKPPMPQPTPAKLHTATEEWMSSCDRHEQQCVTLLSFAPIVKTFVQARHYVTALGRFALGSSFVETWDVYVFPYRYDQSVGGKTVREWVYQLRAEN
jgi:hypothetical protein